MFTGLVETTGTILSVQPTKGTMRVVVAAEGLAGRWKQGDSIAVNGVCLTAIPLDDPAHFAADLAEETVRRTTLSHLQAGSVVNLELPTPAGSPLGGHVVQGHVDGTATLVSLLPIGANTAADSEPDPDTADWRLTLELPAVLAAQVIPQGSITVNGISLTVAKLHEPGPAGTRLLEIAIIPHTYRATNLHTLASGESVNIETDVLAKYARSANRDWTPVTEEVTREWLTGDYLLANGY